MVPFTFDCIYEFFIYSTLLLASISITNCFAMAILLWNYFLNKIQLLWCRFLSCFEQMLRGENFPTINFNGTKKLSVCVFETERSQVEPEKKFWHDFKHSQFVRMWMFFVFFLAQLHYFTYLITVQLFRWPILRFNCHLNPPLGDSQLKKLFSAFYLWHRIVFSHVMQHLLSSFPVRWNVWKRIEKSSFNNSR